MTADLLDVYVLRETGECVFHKEYCNNSENIKSDSTIMSSFLSAIEMFSNDVDTGADMLETANYRFVYHKDHDFIYVARTKKQANPIQFNAGLTHVAQQMRKHLPDKFSGDVTPFRRINNLIDQEFFKIPLDGVFVFSGKYAYNLQGNDMKIYSYLRLKGRASLRTISKMMDIPENETYRITNNLVKNEYLVSYT